MKKTMTAFLLVALVDMSALHAAEFTYTDSDSAGSNIALGYPVPEPQLTTDPGAWFRDYAYMHAVHQSLALDHDFISAHVVGQTWAGMDIWAYRFGDAGDVTVDGEPEGSVLINGGIHAREWQTQEATTGLMEYLAANANDGDIVQYLIENLNIVIIPVHNIDGFRQTQTYWNKVTSSEAQPRDGRMRRKNLHAPGNTTVDDSLGTTGDNLYGIDLNRNAEHGFGANNGSSGSFTSLIYRGAAIASEPETAALLAARSLAPNLRFYEDTHSFSQLMYVPQIGEAERDRQARALAQLMSDAVGGRYAVSPDPVNGYIGTTADHFAYEYKVPAWTLELEPQPFRGGTQYGGIGVSHDGFILPAAEVPRLRDEYNAMHRNVFYDRTGPAWLREVEVRETASGAVRYHAMWQATGNGRELVVNINDALEPDVTYSLWMAFNKPMKMVDFDNLRTPSFHLVSEDGQQEFSPAGASSSHAWLDQPGGAPDGYLRYPRDAFRFEFTIATADFEEGQWMLEFSNLRDATDSYIDPEPATSVEFVDGKWIGLEKFPLASTGDPVGGYDTDCNHFIRLGGNSSGTTPDRNQCRDQIKAELDSPPDAVISPPSSNSGGGGSLAWLLPVLSLAGIYRRRPRKA